MAVKVQYRDKSGKECSVIFSDERLAEAYAKSHKGSVIVPAEDKKVPKVSVKRLDPGPSPEPAPDDPDPENGLSRSAEAAIKRRLGCHNA